MSIRVTLGDWEAQRGDAQDVRYEVFVLEQKVPLEMEWDEMDAQCLHAVAFDGNGQAVGTGRLLPDGHIGRMAVRQPARGLGIGAMLLETLVDVARKRGDGQVMLNAQIQAEAFYQRYGFVREGDAFMEAGIPPHPHAAFAYLTWRSRNIGVPLPGTWTKAEERVPYSGDSMHTADSRRSHSRLTPVLGRRQSGARDVSASISK